MIRNMKFTRPIKITDFVDHVGKAQLKCGKVVDVYEHCMLKTNDITTFPVVACFDDSQHLIKNLATLELGIVEDKYFIFSGHEIYDAYEKGVSINFDLENFDSLNDVVFKSIKINNARNRKTVKRLMPLLLNIKFFKDCMAKNGDSVDYNSVIKTLMVFSSIKTKKIVTMGYEVYEKDRFLYEQMIDNKISIQKAYKQL